MLRKWRDVVLAAGWPATGEAWAVVGGWEQGGVRGWFRSMQSPADGLASSDSWPTWGLRRFDGLRAMGRNCVISPAERVMWGAEEQGSERSFRLQAETEVNGLYDDAGQPVQGMEESPQQGGMEMK